MTQMVVLCLEILSKFSKFEQGLGTVAPLVSHMYSLCATVVLQSPGLMKLKVLVKFLTIRHKNL